MELDSSKIILNSSDINYTLRRIAYQILETNLEEESIILAGVFKNGAVLANKIKSELKKISSLKIELIQINIDKKNPIVWKRKAGIPPMGIATDLISKMLQRQRFDLVAAGLQRFVELHLVQWVKNCIKETGIKNVVCSGGVFMNVKANKAILEIKDVEKLFIFPSCGDETNSMGAAYLAHVSQCISKNHKINLFTT